MIKYVVAGLLVAIAWLVVVVWQAPLYIAAAVTGLVVFVLLSILAYRLLLARRSAGRLERGLSSQADQIADGLRPEEQAKIQAMKAEFTRGIGALKTSKLAGGGASALYALPWYMIIGPPGGGKTTALENCGLNFPASKRKIRGVGGTRNCDWFLANEAVILDTAGRWATQDDDREEWLQFLDLLRRHRPKKPLNGILVAIPVHELAGQDEESVVELAVKLKERIDELTQRLHMMFPAYVLLTKCDLLPGFLDVFGDLAKSARGQVWGFTLSRSELAAGGPGAVCLERFDELSGVLERKVVHRVSKERRLEARERAYQFPQQVATIRANLRAFIETLFASDVYQDVPLLRGVYLTSGTQEGRPIDRLRHRLATELGVEPRTPETEKPGEKKSYFLRDVFGRVVFPDQHLAVLAKAEERRQGLRLAALTAGAFCLSIALGAFPYMIERDHIEIVRKFQEIASGLTATGREADFPLAEVAKLRTLMPSLCGVTTPQAWPPADSELGKSACRLYGHLFDRLLVSPLNLSAIDEMNAAVGSIERRGDKRSGLSGEEYANVCRSLKTHLILSDGAARHEPSLESDAGIRGWATARLAERLPPAKDASIAEARQENLDFYLRVVSKHPDLRKRRDATTVAAARKALLQTDVPEQILRQVLRDVQREDDRANITLDNLFGNAAVPYTSMTDVERQPAEIHRAFTREAWDRIVRKRLSSSVDNCDPWVVAEDPATAPQPEAQLREAKKRYFDAYRQAWRSMVASITYSPPTTDLDVPRTLAQITAGPITPLRRLMAQVKKNADLEIPPAKKEVLEGLAEQVLEKGENKARAKAEKKLGVELAAEESAAPKIEYVREVRDDLSAFARFGVSSADPGDDFSAGPPLEKYIDALEKLQSSFPDKVIANPADGAREFEAAARALLQDTELSIQRMGGDGWKSELEKLLLPPIKDLIERSDKSGAGASNNDWCSGIVSPFRAMRDQFPFNPNSPVDVPLDRFNAYLKPGAGQLWSYHGQKLATEIELVGDEFRFRGDAAKRYSAQVPLFLTRALEVQRLLFAGTAPEPSVKVNIKLKQPPAVEYLAFEVGEQKVEHRGGREIAHTVHWPAPGNKPGARVLARGRDASGHTREGEVKVERGDWALFRLLARAELTPKSDRSMIARWRLEELGGEYVTAEVEFGSDSPMFGSERRRATEQKLAPFVAMNRLFPTTLHKEAKACP